MKENLNKIPETEEDIDFAQAIESENFSKKLRNGSRSYSWIHVTGDRTRKRAFLTEGPLKGDVASFLANDALFICTGGVNAIHGLKETIIDLGVTEVVEAFDMDQFDNPQVMNGVPSSFRTIVGLMEESGYLNGAMAFTLVGSELKSPISLFRMKP